MIGGFCTAPFVLSSNPTLSWATFTTVVGDVTEDEFKMGFGSLVPTFDSFGTIVQYVPVNLNFSAQFELPTGKLYLAPSQTSMVVELFSAEKFS